jgi:calcium/calmodulin-dependent protein kinase (CaM kinase) II
MMPDAIRQEILAANQKLLDAIVCGDWKTYADLCDPSITCLEPEAKGHVVEGMPFHKFYFDLPAANPKPAVVTTVSMANPHVRVMGDVAVLAYIRLNQKLSPTGEPVTVPVEETRVWQRQGGAWKHVHFHRSVPN